MQLSSFLFFFLLNYATQLLVKIIGFFEEWVHEPPHFICSLLTRDDMKKFLWFIKERKEEKETKTSY